VKRLAFLFIFVCVLLGGVHQAQATCRFTAGGTMTSTIALPTNLVVPRNSTVGTVLWDSGWVQGGSGTASILCDANFTQSMNWNVPGLQQVSGMGYVYALPNLPGVGIRAGWFWGNTGSPGTWAWIGQPPATVQWMQQAFVMRSFLQVQLVAIGPISSGTQSFPSPTISVWYGNVNAAQLTLTQASIKTTVLACTTPDVAIPMGKHVSSELKGVGTTTSTSSFVVSLNNCPAGMTSIQYRIDPTTTVLNSSQSVVSLDASSGATGVGVQLLNSSGTAFPLSTNQTFSGYNTTTGGSYTISLGARYYQTAATVGAGSANTSMALTMTYQ
jgi:major type 1 subunit fimbrin (pilin)